MKPNHATLTILIICGWAALISAASARMIGDTEVVSERALKRLTMNNGVTLQWLWGFKPGTLTASETAGGVRLKGGQGPHEGDELTLDGVIVKLEERRFTFKGRIVIVDNETSQPCVRDGLYTFRITGTRKYWRMKEQEARCAGRADLVDYVDILF